ncbi:hypothetical protein B4144_0964 [Bacillus atrophaeus]|nr:hypothetical protein B4144_0964 [Bacillus atrophaeus]
MTNPATGDIVAEVAYAGKKEAKKACCGRRAKELTEVGKLTNFEKNITHRP